MLVTGIEGFTGHYVAAELEQRGFEVHGTTRVPADRPGWHQVDLLDAGGLAAVVAHVAPTHVVHLAAIAFAASADIETIYRVNIVGTRNLLSALAAHTRVDAVVLASSASVYGNADASPIDEDMPPRPTNDYAVSKLAMEFLAATWTARLPLTVTRPFNYTGIGQSADFLIPKIVAAFRARAAAIDLGNLDVAREFSDVRDVAADYGALVEAGPAVTVNLCSGIAHRLRDVIALATEITGHTIEVRINPAFVRNGEIACLAGDPTRLRAHVPQMARRSLVETMRWMLED